MRCEGIKYLQEKIFNVLILLDFQPLALPKSVSQFSHQFTPLLRLRLLRIKLVEKSWEK